MRRARKLILLTGILVIAAGTVCSPASAQVATTSAEGVPLSKALDEFAKRSGVNVVYATRLVANLKSTCTRAGGQPRAQLACLLEGTGLEARWPRADQAVLSKIQSPSATRDISGVVLDAESNEPIPGAHVLLTDDHSGVATAENGAFHLKHVSTGPVHITVSHLGYESEDRVINPGEDIEPILLQPHTIEGTAVVVEENRESVDDELSGQSEESIEGIQGYAFSSMFGDLALGSSVAPSISRTGEISGQFVVRGGLPDQNVFKLDGAPVYQPWHSQGLFSVVQPNTVRGIKLFAGPLPADQGGYLASVLDADLNAGGDAVSAQAALSTTVGGVSFSGPLAPGVTAMFAGRRSHPGLNRTHSMSLPNSEQLSGGAFYDAVAKVGVQSTNNLFSFTVYRGNDNMDWSSDPGAVNPAANDMDGSPDSDDSHARSDVWSNGVYSFRHRYFADNLMVTNTLYVSSFDASIRVPQAAELVSLTDDSQHIRDAGMKIDVDYRAAAAHTLKTGVEFVQHHIEWSNHQGVDYYRDEVMEGAVFAHDTWSISDRLVVRPGIRVSWFGNGVGMRPEPRLHAMYTLSPATSLHASWSRQVQYLHQINDIATGGLPSSLQRWSVSSDNTVSPSTGQQANFGVTTLAGPRWTLTADVYWRDFENVFLPRSQVLTTFPSEVASINQTGGFGDFEQGSTKAYGIELAANYKYHSYVFSTSYTGSRSLFRVPSALNYHSGIYDTPHLVRVVTGYDGPRLSLLVSGEARTGYPTLASIRGTAQQIGSDRLPTYFRLDLSAGYRFHKFGLNWNVQGRIYNVTDRENIVGYEYDREFLYLRRTSLLGVTRWPTFNLQVSW